MPYEAEWIIDNIRSHGYEAFIVGGCVRDAVLGRIPGDWDITTSAKPEQVKEIFGKTVDTGLKHGTVTIIKHGSGYEVTTYRIDGEYLDGRHPETVEFTPDLREDLKRRDFTINAMAYHPKEGIVDLFHGMDDMQNKVIRCVGDPLERFHEDALRIMRAVRFSAQLGFEIEEETKAGISRLTQNLRNVSAERIQAELVKLLVSPHPDYLRVAYETGITKEFLPEFDRMMATPQNTKHHCYSVGEHTVAALEHIVGDKVLRLTMLLHDVAKPVCRTTDASGNDHFYGHPKEGSEMARKILRRLKFDNDTTDKVCRLVCWHDDNPPLSEKNVRRAVSRIGVEQYPALFAVKRADILAQSEYQREEKLSYVDGYEALYREILEKNQCLTIRDLAVNGSDLIAAGMKPGKEIGETLKSLLELVLDDPELNNRELLLERICSHE